MRVTRNRYPSLQGFIMSLKQIVPGLYRLSAGPVNVYVLEDAAGLVLIDTGFPGKTPQILKAIGGLKRSPSDVKHIVLTHAHFDHVGNLAALKQATGAQTWMHAIDAPIAESGGPARPMLPAREIPYGLIYRLFAKPDARVAPAKIDHRVQDGDLLPIASGLRAIHVPGHCAGQIALFWEKGDVIFAGDVCTNILGLGPPFGWEDEAQGRASQRKLAALSYDTACFGHGKPIVGGASARMRRAFRDG